MGIGKADGTDRSNNKRVNQVSSATNRLIDRYSTLANERDTDACLLDFQEMGEPPMEMKNPLIDQREFGQDAQSASQNALREKDGEADKKIPRQECPFRKFTRRIHRR
ncbi:uncharacterized protein LOC124895981 [Capsicum annuum]|uniref:uncharacterized protein LOC124895981 n=1 Tax=Capsicum annuum TaxID=4072 RepID=UPI001FB17631|nr:uncharacterized protein LOC124895981 [Capsicum annuum]